MGGIDSPEVKILATVWSQESLPAPEAWGAYWGIALRYGGGCMTAFAKVAHLALVEEWLDQPQFTNHTKNLHGSNHADYSNPLDLVIHSNDSP
jgi:hypothetical protein